MTKPRRWTADTSVAVTALNGDHPHHDRVAAVVRDRKPALAGHAAFETIAVLTRLPGLMSIDAATAARAIDISFPNRCWLSAEQTADLFHRLGTAGLVGGAIYDAMVGEAARVANTTLLTLDRRAQRTYDFLGVSYDLLA